LQIVRYLQDLAAHAPDVFWLQLRRVSGNGVNTGPDNIIIVKIAVNGRKERRKVIQESVLGHIRGRLFFSKNSVEHIPQLHSRFITASLSSPGRRT
jgi:hypothetical protein